MKRDRYIELYGKERYDLITELNKKYYKRDFNWLEHATSASPSQRWRETGLFCCKICWVRPYDEYYKAAYGFTDISIFQLKQLIKQLDDEPRFKNFICTPCQRNKIQNEYCFRDE